MKIPMIAVLTVSVMVSLGVTGGRLTAAQESQSFKDLLEQRVKEKQQKQKKAIEKKATQKAKKEAEEKQRQSDTCSLIKDALSNYFEVWESVAGELGAELTFDMGDPPDEIDNVKIREFLDHDQSYEKCSFYFIDQILWDRNNNNQSRKAYFKFKIAGQSKPYYITIFSTYYNPKVTLPAVKSKWVPLYNRRYISQKTIVSLLDPKKLVKFKKDVKLFLLKSMQ